MSLIDSILTFCLRLEDMAYNTKPKYIVVGGNPFLVYNKGLRVIGMAFNKKQVQEIVEQNYYECAGLMIIIDTETGCKAEGLDLKFEMFQSAQISP